MLEDNPDSGSIIAGGEEACPDRKTYHPRSAVGAAIVFIPRNILLTCRSALVHVAHPETQDFVSAVHRCL